MTDNNQKLIILSAYTGILCCDFGDMHADVEKRLGRPIWTHQFASKIVRDEIRAAYRDDFFKLVPHAKEDAMK